MVAKSAPRSAKLGQRLGRPPPFDIDLGNVDVRKPGIGFIPEPAKNGQSLFRKGEPLHEVTGAHADAAQIGQRFGAVENQTQLLHDLEAVKQQLPRRIVVHVVLLGDDAQIAESARNPSTVAGGLELLQRPALIGFRLRPVAESELRVRQ